MLQNNALELIIWWLLLRSVFLNESCFFFQTETLFFALLHLGWQHGLLDDMSELLLFTYYQLVHPKAKLKDIFKYFRTIIR